MKSSVVTAVLVLALAAGLAGAPAPGRASSPGTVELGHVRVTLRAGTSQVVTVHHTQGWHARVSLWTRSGTHWHRVLDSRSGRTGYGGLVAARRREQGTGTTPLGTFGLISSFGTHPQAAGWRLGYRQIRAGDFWVEDNASAYYNRFRNQSQGGFRWRLPTSAPNGSERLSDYPVAYEYAVVTSFNQAQVRHRGAGIFLHVNGSGATGGCVSVPRWMMRALMTRLDPTAHPVIAIGR